MNFLSSKVKNLTLYWLFLNMFDWKCVSFHDFLHLKSSLSFFSLHFYLFANMDAHLFARKTHFVANMHDGYILFSCRLYKSIRKFYGQTLGFFTCNWEYVFLCVYLVCVNFLTVAVNKRHNRVMSEVCSMMHTLNHGCVCVIAWKM